MEFVHPILNEEISAIAGHYTFIGEEILSHESGPVLYFVGYAHMESSCCGFKGCGYAIVAGRIVRLRCARTPDDRPVSLVTPVEEAFHQEISRMIRERQGVSQVHFMLASGDKKIVY
jgi:hypothetical protein